MPQIPGELDTLAQALIRVGGVRMESQAVKARRRAPACLALASAAALCTTVDSIAAASLNLACSGNSYTASGPFPTPETYSLRISGAKSVFIGAPGKAQPAKARIIANNAFQLKFRTGESTGEYFHFTGDLFLLHSDGRLTRLTCQPS